MSLTYNEILNNMKTAFFSEKGESVEEFSDLEMRFKAVASEIYAVSAYGSFILRQGFPQTATGEYLDRHAALRSITRKKASCATGSLTFSLAEPIRDSVAVPKGTICSVEGSPYIQFSTDSEAVIPYEESSVTVRATAVKSGEEYNVGAGQVTVMVNPPDCVVSVTNASPFMGGNYDESDEALRERILSSYRSVKSGVNAASLRETILTLDGVSDAFVSAGGEGIMNVCLKTLSADIPQELKDKVSDLLGFASLCGIELNFIQASEQPFDVIAEVKALSGYDTEKIKGQTEKKIREFCSSGKIGQSYTASAIAAACRDIEGIEYIDVFISSDESGVVSCKSTQYLRLKKTEVGVHE